MSNKIMELESTNAQIRLKFSSTNIEGEKTVSGTYIADVYPFCVKSLSEAKDIIIELIVLIWKSKTTAPTNLEDIFTDKLFELLPDSPEILLNVIIASIQLHPLEDIGTTLSREEAVGLLEVASPSMLAGLMKKSIELVNIKELKELFMSLKEEAKDKIKEK